MGALSRTSPAVAVLDSCSSDWTSELGAKSLSVLYYQVIQSQQQGWKKGRREEREGKLPNSTVKGLRDRLVMACRLEHKL